MNVLMVSPETVPFSKSGGLADVIGALSEALAKAGAEVSVLMPMFSFINPKGFKKDKRFSVSMMGSTVEVSTMVKTVKKVRYVGLVHPYFTNRKGIYGDTSFAPYQDNAERFMLFSKAVLPYIKASKEKFDMVHCHDWATGLVPYLIKMENPKIKTVYTIHNLAYQGEFSRYDALLGGFSLDDSLFAGGTFDKRLNMMKAGIQHADKVTTVSPTYAKEICEKEQGCNLDWLLRHRKDDLLGIINGIDYRDWNPKTDEFLPVHYSTSNLSGKAEIKKEIQKEFGLAEEPETPLFSMISRLADQKGFSELLSGSPSALEQILCERKCQFIVIGTGDSRFEEKLKDLDARYPNISVRIVFSNRIAHVVEAASDFFLMPSRYEPCGLNQLYSLHYGTIPVAHRTGGLADTIIDLQEDEKNGDGFLFERLSPEEIVATVNKTIKFYNEDKKAVLDARIRGMKADFTWEKSALSYLNLYNTLATQGRRQNEERQ